MTSSLAERVERERASHDDDDVLTNNLTLKARFFSHMDHDPAQHALWDEQGALVRGLAGKTILDLGCGKGEAALDYLKEGASVEGIDICTNYVNDAATAVREAGYAEDRFNFQVMDAHKLEFDDDQFDLVVGNAILHHLEPEACLKELGRVLKPGGTAIFLEPLLENPLLMLFRVFTPKARTIDERPFSRRDLREFSKMAEFDFEVSYGGLLTSATCVFTSVFLPNHPKTFLPRWAYAVEKQLNRNSVTRALFGPWNRLALFRFTKRS